MNPEKRHVVCTWKLQSSNTWKSLIWTNAYLKLKLKLKRAEPSAANKLHNNKKVDKNKKKTFPCNTTQEVIEIKQIKSNHKTGDKHQNMKMIYPHICQKNPVF